MSDSTLSAGANLLDIAGNLTSTTTSPLLGLTGTSPGSVIADAAASFVSLSASAGLAAPTTTLGGPLVNAQNATLSSGDPVTNVKSFVFVGDSATLTSTSLSPLLSFDATNVDTSGNILTVRRSASASAPSRVTLSGPLFSATNGSSFDTASLGFNATFGTSSACCSGFFISQGAQLTSSTASALIQLTGSTFNSGPSTQSGRNFFNLTDTVTGFPGSELVAPASVSLQGPLLSATDSTLTALVDLLTVNRSSLTSTSALPLIQLAGTTGTTIQLGGTDPIANSPTAGRLLNLVSSATSGSPASPASVSLGGPLLSATNTTLTLTSDVLGVFNGATLTSASSSPLIQLSTTSLTAGTTSMNGDVLTVSGTGAAGGTTQALVSLSGPLLSASSGSNLSVTGGLLLAESGGKVTVTGSTLAFVSLTGGTHSIATNTGTAMVRLFGRDTPTTTASEVADGVTLTLGTDQPLQSGGTVLETTGATVSGQKVMRIDTALLNATAPLLNLTASSKFTTVVDALDLSLKAKVTSLGPVAKLDGSVLNVNSGALVNVAGGSLLKVTGDLIELRNASTLNINSGPLLNVSGGSVVNVSGALVNFAGTGGNAVNITNTLCAPCTNFSGIPVAVSGGAVVTIGPNPLKNPSLGSLALSNPTLSTGGTAVLVVNGPTSKVTIGAP